MALRYDDVERTLLLSVRDLLDDTSAPSLEVVRSRQARAAAGRQVHDAYAAEQLASVAEYRREVTVRRTLVVDAWTVTLWGRVDGLHLEGDHTVVEEVKSTALDARRLYGTAATDYPAWRDQLAIYLWLLADEGHPEPVGRLVLVSLVDGARHVLGVALDRAGTASWVLGRLRRLVEARESRIAWLAARREAVVPRPWGEWRPGQQEIAEAVEWGVEAGHAVLAQAPTGLGKTDAALYGVLRLALRTDRQVFWATARTTQQEGATKALERLRGQGLALRSVVLSARDKVCPAMCRAGCPRRDGHADRSWPVVRELLERGGHTPPAVVVEEGERQRLCPAELAHDLCDHVDVVVGDANYVFDPAMFLRRHFADDAGKGWIVVQDEVHQLPERVREALSPRVDAALARSATSALWSSGAAFAPFVALAESAERAIVDAVQGDRGEHLVPELDPAPFVALTEQIDARALDYAVLVADRPAREDPWTDLARRLLAFAPALGELGQDRVTIGSGATDAEWLGVLCLDASGWLGARIASLGGFVGLSATLLPYDLHRELLGLPAEGTDFVSVPSGFPPEHRKVLVASRVSTAFKDRERHAGPTAALIADCVRAVPGNVAVYFPSFAMLDDLVDRIAAPEREWVRQRPGMDDALRAEALARLAAGGPPKVLCAVLGGVFAEGIDLPPGALSAVIVIGPALPPIGLALDLLREHHETRFGDGFRTTSLVPGLTRVVQAAGRLVRRPEDRGVVLLVDRRFRWRDVLSLLPEEWRPELASDPAAAIRAFFAPAG